MQSFSVGIGQIGDVRRFQVAASAISTVIDNTIQAILPILTEYGATQCTREGNVILFSYLFRSYSLIFSVTTLQKDNYYGLVINPKLRSVKDTLNEITLNTDIYIDSYGTSFLTTSPTMDDFDQTPQISQHDVVKQVFATILSSYILTVEAPVVVI